MVKTGYQNTELAFSSGRSRVPFIQSGLRELWFYSSLFDFELSTLYIPGKNTLSNFLWVAILFESDSFLAWGLISSPQGLGSFIKDAK